MFLFSRIKILYAKDLSKHLPLSQRANYHACMADDELQVNQKVSRTSVLEAKLSELIFRPFRSYCFSKIFKCIDFSNMLIEFLPMRSKLILVFYLFGQFSGTTFSPGQSDVFFKANLEHSICSDFQCLLAKILSKQLPFDFQRKSRTSL